MTCLDMTKAFDSLPHIPMLNVFNAAGVSHGFLCWLSSYLSNRRQFIVHVLDGVIGSIFHANSGVPQGSVLGPYLFAAYMGQLFPHSTIGPKCVLYADDLTIICLLYTSPSPRDLSTSRMPSSA